MLYWVDVVGWDKINIKDHLSPAEAETESERGNRNRPINKIVNTLYQDSKFIHIRQEFMIH